MKTRAQTINQIETFFNRLDRALDGKSDWKKYLDQIKKETKDHRDYMGAAMVKTDKLSASQTVKLCAVQDIFEHAMGVRPEPRVYDVFSCKPSLFMAVALWHYYHTKISILFSPEEVQEILSWSYAELNN
jgi:hypothetical protein